MRCDVCYTRIPLGESRCPNCGMVIKKDSSVTLTSEPEKKQIIKKPNISKTFGFHELFHIFVMIGSFMHYLAIVLYVL